MAFGVSRKFWDHAFASGRVFGKPERSFIMDKLFLLFERIFSKYFMHRVWREFENMSVTGDNVLLGYGARIINRNSKEAVKIGNNVVCRGIIRVEKNGTLEIGDNVYIGDDVIISAAERIVVGSDTLLAHGVQVFDNTSHPVKWDERAYHFRMLLGKEKKKHIEIPAKEVVIGRNCWLSMNSIVLKGVTVGDRSVVGAGSVITSDVAADTFIAGSVNYIEREL